MIKQSGFTLLEVLISLLVLAVGIAAAMQLFPHALTQSRMAAERTQSAAVATSWLNQLQGMSRPEQFFNWAANVNALHTLSQVSSVYGEYDSALYQGLGASVQQLAGSPDTYRVTFSVRMSDDRDETYVTYVTRR